MVKILPAVITIGLLASLSACNTEQDKEASTIKRIDGSKIPAAEPKNPTRSWEPGGPNEKMTLKQQTEFAINDLAGRLSIEPGSIEIFGARNVSWRTGALGCPEPGMQYTQALVPGTSILLRANNEMHAYHASMGGKPFYCPRERVEQPALGPEAEVN